MGLTDKHKTNFFWLALSLSYLTHGLTLTARFVSEPRPQQTGEQVGGFSSTTLALSICFSIVLSLAVGFLGGFFFSVLHKRQQQSHQGPPPVIGDLGGVVEKNKNVYVETPAKTVTEKQVNVLFNPVKPNNKLPNGGADLQVTPKKVYL